MRSILTSLTRGLSTSTCCRADHGEERGVPISYPGPEPGRRPGAAVELAGRAHAVAADHSAADRPGAQARARRNRGRRIAWPRRSSRPAFRAKRSRSIRAAPTSARRCSTAVGRSLIFGGTADRRSLSRQRQGPGARPGLLQDPDRRRPGRSLGRVSRRDGRQRVPEQRTRLHQLLGHLGQPSHPGDRRRDCRAAGGDPSRCRPTIPTPAWRRSRSPASPTRSRSRSTPTCRRPA